MPERAYRPGPVSYEFSPMIWRSGSPTVESRTRPRRTTMTVTVDGSSCPSVFDAGLPTINYEYAQHPDEAHAIISQARQKAPIAIGPYGPELLTYDLVRTALRDPRFRVPQGMFLAAQGITSGPLWDRVAANILSLNGEEHHRLRRLVCKAFTPKATPRLRTTIVDIITGLVDRHSAHGRCDVVTDIARQYPIPVICALLGAPPEDWELFSSWTDDILKAFSWNAAKETSAILTAWDALEPAARIDRRPDLRADPRRGRWRSPQRRRTPHARGRAVVGRHRHHPPPVECGGTRAVRSPRPVGTPGPASGACGQCRRGAHPPFADHLRHVARHDGGCRSRRRQNRGRHNSRRQHWGGQPGSRGLRRPRPSRHQPRGRPTDPDIRRRHALLPRCPSRPPRVGRSPGGDDTAHAQRPPPRSGPMEPADRTERTHHSAHRIRRRTLNPPTSHELGRVPLHAQIKSTLAKKWTNSWGPAIPPGRRSEMNRHR